MGAEEKERFGIVNRRKPPRPSPGGGGNGMRPVPTVNESWPNPTRYKNGIKPVNEPVDNKVPVKKGSK